MRKVLVFIASDGWAHTLSFMLKRVKSLFFHRSITFCLYARRDDVATTSTPIGEEYDCKILHSLEELKALHFDLLMLYPCQKWIDAGSTVCVISKNNVPVAFGWCHFIRHDIKYVGKFELGDDIAWMGPQFVHKKHRGQGLQKLVIMQSVLNLPKRIQTIITSVNQSNQPSLRSVIKMKFRIGLKVSNDTGFFSSHVSDLTILDPDSLKYLKVKR